MEVRWWSHGTHYRTKCESKQIGLGQMRALIWIAEMFGHTILNNNWTTLSLRYKDHDCDVCFTNTLMGN